MNTDTGDLYASREAAIADGVPPEKAVQLEGDLEAILALHRLAAKNAREQSKRGWVGGRPGKP